MYCVKYRPFASDKIYCRPVLYAVHFFPIGTLQHMLSEVCIDYTIYIYRLISLSCDHIALFLSPVFLPSTCYNPRIYWPVSIVSPTRRQYILTAQCVLTNATLTYFFDRAICCRPHPPNIFWWDNVCCRKVLVGLVSHETHHPLLCCPDSFRQSVIRCSQLLLTIQHSLAGR